MPKALSPLVGTVLLVAFAIGVGTIVTLFMTDITKTSTRTVSNASESLTLCSAASISIPKDSIYCLSGYNLTLLMHLDEGSGTTASDSSENGNTGTLSNEGGACGGTACPSWVTGRYGNALYFDGVGDYADIPHSTSLSISGTGLTVEAWVSVTGNTSALDTARIVAKGTDAYDLQYSQSRRLFNFVISTVDQGEQGVTASTVVQYNQWYHVAGTYNGNSIGIYVNGVLESSLSATGNIGTNTGPVRLGNRGADNLKNFNGSIDEVRIYSRSLSATEIKQHHESGITELFRNKSVVKFQLENNGQYNLRKNFDFLLSTSSASNVSAITLNSDLTSGNIQLITLANLTMSTLSTATVQNIFVSSVACPNVYLIIKELGLEC